MELGLYQQMRYYYGKIDVPHGVFTRHGGVSSAPFDSLNLGGTVGDEPAAVRQNHERIYQALGVNSGRAVTTWQVHGADVVIATQPLQHRRWLARADGIVTNQPDTPLMMRYADCTPLLFHDPVQRAVGIAHAGWRGTVKGVGSAVVRAMQRAYGSSPADIRALIGPSISSQHFQVGEEVVAAMRDAYGDLTGILARDSLDSTAYIDLWEANKRDLLRAGVTQIEVMGICTYQRTDEFYSHRAEKGNTGRFGAVISL